MLMNVLALFKSFSFSFFFCLKCLALQCASLNMHIDACGVKLHLNGNLRLDIIQGKEPLHQFHVQFF